MVAVVVGTDGAEPLISEHAASSEPATSAVCAVSYIGGAPWLSSQGASWGSPSSLVSSTRGHSLGGGSADRVFWQVSGLVTLGTTSHMEGVVLTQTSVTMGTGASLTGRLLAQSAVNLSGNTVVEPAP